MIGSQESNLANQHYLNPLKVTIIGAGWLGAPLLKSLTSQKINAIGTKRSKKGAIELQKAGLKVVDYRADKGEITASKGRELFQDRYIIITLPPSGDYSEGGYLQALQNCARFAKQFKAKRVIFTSSISVYGEASGLINEALPPMPKRKNGIEISTFEAWLRTQFQFPHTILRLGGLIGHGRHPIFSLSGKQEVKSPHNMINLLHIRDLIGAIEALLNYYQEKSVDLKEEFKESEIYNLVTPVHLTRKSYYEEMAKRFELPPPQFAAAKPELKRIIDGSKISEVTGFTYRELDLINASLEIL